MITCVRWVSCRGMMMLHAGRTEFLRGSCNVIDPWAAFEKGYCFARVPRLFVVWLGLHAPLSLSPPCRTICLALTSAEMSVLIATNLAARAAAGGRSQSGHSELSNVESLLLFWRVSFFFLCLFFFINRVAIYGYYIHTRHIGGVRHLPPVEWASVRAPGKRHDADQ